MAKSAPSRKPEASPGRVARDEASQVAAPKDALVLEAAQELLSLRPQHDLARQTFESRRREVKAAAAGGADGKAAGGADASGALALEASKAILLLRGPREALEEAAERAAAAKERRTKRR